jgi:hypothetical protein
MGGGWGRFLLCRVALDGEANADVRWYRHQSLKRIRGESASHLAHMSAYNTNLAAEFHILSMLYRCGADASLTLGNNKAVDIVLALPSGQTATIDVKGVAGPHD